MQPYLHGVLYFLTCFYLSTTQEHCQHQKYFYVSSNGTNARQCLTAGNINHPCATLLYLIEHMDESHFQFLFEQIAQCYTINILSNLILSNSVVKLRLNNTSIVGASNVADLMTIHCEGQSGMIIDSVTNFNMKQLQFSGCSFNVTDYRNDTSDNDVQSNFTAIWINSSSNIAIFGCSFENHIGSSILLENVYLNIKVAKSNFTGNSSLLNDMRSRSGGIIVNLHNYAFIYINVDECMFQYNVAHSGGAISFVSVSHNTVFMSILNSHFTYNMAFDAGGAVKIDYTDPADGNLHVEIMKCSFTGNRAHFGGAVAAIIEGWCNGCRETTNITFSNTSFVSNIASSFGFAIALKGPDLADSNGYGTGYLLAWFSDSVLIANNFGGVSGAVISTHAALVFSHSSVFSNNTGTAMVLLDSKAIIYGFILFSNSTGTLGGAICIKGESYIDFGPNSSSYFINNTVSFYGGAIYASVTKYCAFILINTNSTRIIFDSNYATNLEQSIYMVSSDECSPTSTNIYSVSQFVPNVKTQVLFPLYTLKIVFEPDINEVMLGEKFVLKPTETLDMFGHYSTGIGYIRFKVHYQKHSKNSAYHLRGPSIISLDNYTENLEFFVVGPSISEDKQAEINIYYHWEGASDEVRKFSVTFNLVQCRIGYKYSLVKEVCVCESQSPSSSSDLIQCEPNGQILCVKRYHWYSVRFQKTYPCPAQNCWFMYGKCPIRTEECDNSTEYCGIKEEDDVCWSGRSGFLCSQCAQNQSFTFSAFMCTSSKSCHSWNTFLLLLALLLYWILFIFVLLLGLSLNLGSGSGFMLGIVYFFSVATIYTKSSEIYSNMWVTILLYVDMAIALCDPELLGYVTNTCFAKTWTNPLPHELFRYATPMILMLALVLLTLYCRYCRMPKFLSLAENSPIHAMCLLILLSYTSVSCTSLKLLVPMVVNGSLRVQVAPTVSYFSGEHIPYAVVGICTELFFCIPLCVLFLFAPLISRHINLVKLRLKPIVDEFQACYKPEYRCFAGFYFLMRQIIYVVNMTYSDPFPQLNYVLTSINILILLTHMTIQPYSKKWLNILDAILLADIVILSQYPPVKVPSITSVNQIFHYILIPYALILFPTCYLFGALGLIFIRKFWSIPSLKLCIKRPGNCLNTIFKSLVSKLKFRSNTISSNLQNPISEAPFREPLLEDLESERSRLYGST